MNIASESNSNESHHVPSEFSLEEGTSWLTSPHELSMSSSAEEDFPENGYSFVTLQDLIDVTSEIKYYSSVCLFRIAYYMYRPEQDSRGRPWYGNAASSNNQQNKSDVERLIWLIDVFGHSGQNMAVVLLSCQGMNCFFDNSIKFWDSGHLGKFSIVFHNEIIDFFLLGFMLTPSLISCVAPGALIVVENPPQILRYLDGAKQTVPVLDLTKPVKLVTMKANKIQKQMPVIN